MGGSLTPPRTRSAPATNWTQVAIAIIVLLLGASVYVFARPADSAPFFSAMHISAALPALSGPIGASLPTFVHVFAFSLLTAAWLGGGREFALVVCLAWVSVDFAFEVGQHPQVAQILVEYLPSWFETLPILDQADNYFLRGTFDAGDLISIILGAAVAYLVIRCTTLKEECRA